MVTRLPQQGASAKDICLSLRCSSVATCRSAENCAGTAAWYCSRRERQFKSISPHPLATSETAASIPSPEPPGGALSQAQG